MNLDMETRRFTYGLNNIVRYNTQSRVKDETVAAHSFYVALFTTILCDRFGTDDYVKLTAIQFALIHDIPEVVINDITYDAKVAMPEINGVLARYEAKVQEELNGELGEAYTVPSTPDELFAKHISTIADIISVLQYTEHEKSLGNLNVDDWVDGCFCRIVDELQEVEKARFATKETCANVICEIFNSTKVRPFDDIVREREMYRNARR